MSTRLEPIDDIVLTPTELLDAFAVHEHQAALLALAVGRLETSGEWAADGSVSMVAWLRHHGRLSQRDAARWVCTGRFLDRFPAIADAARHGRSPPDRWRRCSTPARRRSSRCSLVNSANWSGCSPR